MEEAPQAARPGQSRRSSRKEKSLRVRGLGATVADSAKVAGVHPCTLYRWREQDPEFAFAWENAHDTLVEGLEMMAFRMASAGDVRLLMFLLKSCLPDKYQGKEKSKQTKQVGMTLAEIAAKARQWL